MTRGLVVLTVLLFIGMVVSLAVGFGSQAVGLMVVGLFVCGPGFIFCLGFTIGRASNEFALVRRSDSNAVSHNQVGRVRSRQHEPMN